MQAVLVPEFCRAAFLFFKRLGSASVTFFIQARGFKPTGSLTV